MDITSCAELRTQGVFTTYIFFQFHVGFFSLRFSCLLWAVITAATVNSWSNTNARSVCRNTWKGVPCRSVDYSRQNNIDASPMFRSPFRICAYVCVRHTQRHSTLRASNILHHTIRILGSFDSRFTYMFTSFDARIAQAFHIPDAHFMCMRRSPDLEFILSCVCARVFLLLSFLAAWMQRCCFCLSLACMRNYCRHHHFFSKTLI